jgi:hydroxymethylglutaryl-CoA lyase
MKIIECPRDAMQGIDTFIPTKAKTKYINQLLKVGFDTIDFGSFVSTKSIPQMKDTAEVVSALDTSDTTSKLLAIVANTRGAQEASMFPQITYLGFPMSISETFQVRNTNKTISQALNSLEEIKNICIKTNKKLVTYISMGFGNPFGDPYASELVSQFVDILLTLGSDIISLADTIGVSTPENIHELFTSLTHSYPSTEIGIHLHSTPPTRYEKIEAAFNAGCKRIDGALKGFGGCPMANDELVGNLPTEDIISFVQSNSKDTILVNDIELKKALALAAEVFSTH